MRKKHSTLFAFLFFSFSVLFHILYPQIKPVIQFFLKPQNIELYLQQYGELSKLIFILLMAIQIILAFIPGGPLQIVAGYMYGSKEGLFLCLIGTLIGTVIVMFMNKIIGNKILKLFISDQKLSSIEFLNNQTKLSFIIFLIFFIPGMPKDFIVYTAGIINIKALDFLLISTMARIPSIYLSTISGFALYQQNYTIAIILFAISFIILALGYYINQKYFEQPSKPKLQD